jgi:hypothetical protein
VATITVKKLDRFIINSNVEVADGNDHAVLPK